MDTPFVTLRENEGNIKSQLAYSLPPGRKNVLE